MTPKRWRTSVKTRGVKTLPGADCDTDNELINAKMNIKLKRLKKGNVVMRYDITAELSMMNTRLRFRTVSLN